jgi:cation:H+ antiporter
MITQLLIFIGALALLLTAAQFFTKSAENIGAYLRMPAFVIGVFIVGIGTSLPELIASVLSVRQGVSEIVAGNIIGANITNILLITGVVAWLHQRDIVLSKAYIFIDLHYLVGAFFLFAVVAYDGIITWKEAIVGVVAFFIYSFYLINDGKNTPHDNQQPAMAFPVKDAGLLLLTGFGIYLGADYTVSSISALAAMAGIPPAVIALTVLSLGTTLPELAVNISAIRQGKAEMAVGNVLGSSIFNAMFIPGAAAMFGDLIVPSVLIGFSLPFMLGAGLFFYLLTQDKKISRWEGMLYICIYVLFMLKVSGIS